VPKKEDTPQLGLDLDGSEAEWPPHERFPYNFSGETVAQRLRADLLASPAPLLVTGYASLEELLGLFRDLATRPPESPEKPLEIRLLLGVEPNRRNVRLMEDWGPALEQEVLDYWLTLGVSLFRCREVFSAINLLDAGKLDVRLSNVTRVHAKVYVTGTAVTLGSSNFTEPGLRRNLEANARFRVTEEPERHQEACALAENLWKLGKDYRSEFRDLLQALLQKVTWQEALARASAEILEGDWNQDQDDAMATGPRLWPSQESGIAQALWVLENVGAVLVADATGSGKTRMGARLLQALQDRTWRAGRRRIQMPVIVCPPTLGPDWIQELAGTGEAASVFSHGVLSRKGSEKRPQVSRALRATQVLTVDEAHNFLNRASQRSRLLYGNVADHVILLTATPINRGARDLLSIVDLLGADNFEEDVLEVVSRLAKGPGGSHRQPISREDREVIRGALQQFVVRRTKRDFNTLIDRDPEAYVNALGDQCRFPEHLPKVYSRKDPPEDCRLALQIREKAKSLRGIANLQSDLIVPRFLRLEGWTDERFLRMRLGGAKALAAYQIRSRLRSSKVALVEHIKGTEFATKEFRLAGTKSSVSGGMIDGLRRLRGKPPGSHLRTPLPDWLSNAALHKEAVDEEIATYEEILALTQAISDFRMDANAEYLQDLLSDHERILAFDSHLISLYDLERRLQERGEEHTILATGEMSALERRRFSRNFRLGAKGTRVIGLCSDALAEGLNLQGASAVVHLDLPTVVRIHEQRIGRVDSMDSPHAQVEVHWPEEPEEFRLHSDEKLFWRLGEVTDLIGSNVPIPEEFQDRVGDEGDPLKVAEIIEAVEQGAEPEGRVTLSDAFHRVRNLVDGPEALIPFETYRRIRKAKARVISSVAVVQARSSWALLAIGASDRTIPRWALVRDLQEGTPTLITSLDEVAEEVRLRLSGQPEDRDFDEGASDLLSSAIWFAEEHHRSIMPRRKQRALEEMAKVLKAYLQAAKKSKDGKRLQIVSRLLSLIEPNKEDQRLDLELVAEWWLTLIRPEWYEYLVNHRGRQPTRLRGLTRVLKRSPISTERLSTIRDVNLHLTPLDRRVVAAIVGVVND
jgi:hypothetical protein